MQTTDFGTLKVQTLIPAPMADRVLPDPSASAPAAESEISNFNLIFIVGFAILISVLARALARRGGRK